MERKGIIMEGNILTYKKMTYIDEFSKIKMTIKLSDELNKVIIRFFTDSLVNIEKVIIDLKDVNSLEGFIVNINANDSETIAVVENIIRDKFYPIIIDWVSKEGIANILIKIIRMNSSESRIYAKYLLQELVDEAIEILPEYQIKNLKKIANNEEALLNLLSEQLLIQMEEFPEFVSVVDFFKK